MDSRSIKNWAKDDQPREKLMAKGSSALSNAELIAILINNGFKQKSALDLAKDLLHACDNSIHRLSRLSYQDILDMNLNGLGSAKAISIIAALELGARREAEDRRKDIITCSEDIASYLKAKLQMLNREIFGIVYLNHGNRVIDFQIISEGGISSTIADPRIILKNALQRNATSIILTHNHPSGNLQPSSQDKAITDKLKIASRLMDINLIDHIIVSETGYYSFADYGIL